MSINKVNTTVEEKSFNFLTNQSSILRTIETNNITFNGVNVIVDKPKRGDVMCITHYEENGTLLGADKQKVVWIDGMSIDPKQLSQEYEPVGICLVVKGNKALVRYREERSLRWSNAKRLNIPYKSFMNDGNEHNYFKIFLNNKLNTNPLVLTSANTASCKAFVDKLNEWFITYLGRPTGTVYCSAELVDIYTDLPATDISENDSYKFRIIVTVNPKNSGTFPFDNFKITQKNESVILLTSSDVTSSHIGYSRNYYIGRNFTRYSEGGCCRAKYYDFIQKNQTAPLQTMTDIDYVPGYSETRQGLFPVRFIDFNTNKHCKILRDNFANYDEYLESRLVKFPCGAGGTIAEFPSGKENTYKLADCTFLNNDVYPKGQSILYPAANWAASISLNAPKLGKGNWWLPSSAEIVEIMRDITYGTPFWDTKPDIINRVLLKLTSISNSGWSMLSASDNRWTSSKCANTIAYYYDGISGILYGNEGANNLYDKNKVSPVTIYEF